MKNILKLNKEIVKIACEGYQSLSKEGKEKRDNMFGNHTKI